MGVSIAWQSATAKWHGITPGARSEFYASLERMFGTSNEGEWLLGQDAIPALLVAAKVATGDSAQSYTALADALSDHEEIRVRATW